MDLTDTMGGFEIEGIAPPGDLALFGGDVFLGDITLGAGGVLENGGLLPPFVEDPIPVFTPTCQLPSASSAPNATLLAKFPLTSDLVVSDKSSDIEAAVAIKGEGLINDIFIDGSYQIENALNSQMQEVAESGNFSIDIQLTPIPGKSIVFAGFGIKSASYTPDDNVEYVFMITNPGMTRRAVAGLVWSGGCPDDGQLWQGYHEAEEERQWGQPTIRVLMRASKPNSKLRLADIEIYGSLEEPTVGCKLASDHRFD